jgi:hypothetical protein
MTAQPARATLGARNHATKPMVRGPAPANSTEAVERFAPLPPWAALEVAKAEGEFARVWIALAGAQMTRNADAQRRLVAARDVREAAAIHEETARGSLERVAEAVERCLDLQLTMVTRLLGAREEERARGSTC